MTWTTPKTWVAGSALTAAELNEQVRDNLDYLYARTSPTMSSDVTRSVGTFADLDVLQFAVVNGKNYTVQGVVTWSHSSVSGGPVFAYNHPGGNARMRIEYSGETSPTSVDREWITSTDSGSGVATVDVVDVARMTLFWIRYTCTADGTFAIRYKRNTAGTLTVQAGSSLFITSD